MKLRNDLDIYDRHGSEWWDERSPRFRSLHGVNRLRVALLDEWVGREIPGRRILDLGCGGGLLAEPLALRGARVIGLDRSGPSLRAGRDHAGACHWAPSYVCGDLMAIPARDASFDAVLLADVLEHVTDPAAAIAEAARVLRSGGWLYASTIDRSWRATMLVVHVAEGIGFIPRGTHDPKLFIPPEELDAAATRSGLARTQRVGESPDLLQCLRARSIRLRRARSTAVAYSVLYRKDDSRC